MHFLPIRPGRRMSKRQRERESGECGRALTKECTVLALLLPFSVNPGSNERWKLSSSCYSVVTPLSPSFIRSAQWTHAIQGGPGLSLGPCDDRRVPLPGRRFTRQQQMNVPGQTADRRRRMDRSPIFANEQRTGFPITRNSD